MPKIVHNESKYFLKQHCHKIANATSESNFISLCHQTPSQILFMLFVYVLIHIIPNIPKIMRHIPTTCNRVIHEE